MRTFTTIAVAASLMAAAGSAKALSISSTGTLAGLPIDVSGTLTAGAGTVTVTLNNNVSDPTSVIQLISGVSFNVTGAIGSGTLSSVNTGNTTVTISSGGSYVTSTGDALSRWVASESGTTVLLTTLSGGNPDRLIIGGPNGSNLYASANASILGDNPSVFETATFIITVSGVTANSIISNPTVYFGTTGETLGTPSVPDSGSTVALLGMALTGGELLRRRFAKA